MTNDEKSLAAGQRFGLKVAFRHSDFGFDSDFGFRHSDFGLATRI
jgi:hypothetical protein